jgi:hypothetical protein
MKGGRGQPSHLRCGRDGFDQPIGQTVLERGPTVFVALSAGSDASNDVFESRPHPEPVAQLWAEAGSAPKDRCANIFGHI